MRAQGLKTQGYRTGGVLRRVILCLFVCIAVWLFAAHVRQLLGLPLTFSLSPRPTSAPAVTAAPEKTPERTSDDITLPGRTWYALQLGAFTQENAAWQLSQEFIPRGAAGFIYHEEDVYRVLAAAYPTRAEAQSVQTRLSDQGVTTYIQVVQEPGLTLRAAGEKKQVDAVREALDHLNALSTQFYTLSGALDKGEMTQSEALSALQSECATCLALKNTLERAFSDEASAAVAPLAKLLETLAQESDALQNNVSAARIGAALKRCQLTVSIGLKQFAAPLTASP